MAGVARALPPAKSNHQKSVWNKNKPDSKLQDLMQNPRGRERPRHTGPILYFNPSTT
jgi:hypothetical protein